MGKILFWAVIIIGVLFVARLLNSHQQARNNTQRQAAGSRSRKPRKAPAQEKMVRCQHCQLYLPQSDAVSKDQQHWYCDKHAHLARSRDTRN